MRISINSETPGGARTSIDGPASGEYMLRALCRNRCAGQYGGVGIMSDERKAACIIAWPAGHSRSPLIHNYWAQKYKLNAEYRREAVPPEKFVNFVTHLRANGYVGGNVTVPHKEIALTVSEPDERARAFGAANC